MKKNIKKIIKKVAVKIRPHFFKLFDFEPNLGNWYYNWIIRQNISHFKDYSPQKVYFEFGVAGGESLISYILAVEKFCREYKQDINQFYVYGFDSFEGLPDKSGKEDDHLTWIKGSMKHPIDQVQEKIAKTNFPKENIFLIKGFFSDSLTAELQNVIKSKGHFPAIINIDCDYYSSSIQALEFLRPLLKSGSVFYFDDIWSFHGNPNLGEIKAIKDFNDALKGQLTPCHIYGLEHQSFIYSSDEWEY